MRWQSTFTQFILCQSCGQSASFTPTICWSTFAIHIGQKSGWSKNELSTWICTFISEQSGWMKKNYLPHKGYFPAGFFPPSVPNSIFQQFLFQPGGGTISKYLHAFLGNAICVHYNIILQPPILSLFITVLPWLFNVQSLVMQVGSNIMLHRRILKSGVVSKIL